MTWATGLSLLVAGATAVGALAFGIRGRRRVAAFAPSRFETEDGMGDHGLELERREALSGIFTCVEQIRAAARIALSTGTASAVAVLAAELPSDPARALKVAAGCFTLGVLGATLTAQLGRLAREDGRRFRDDWNRSRSRTTPGVRRAQ